MIKKLQFIKSVLQNKVRFMWSLSNYPYGEHRKHGGKKCQNQTVLIERLP